MYNYLSKTITNKVPYVRYSNNISNRVKIICMEFVLCSDFENINF
jgi:hypothetical protein